MTAPGQRGPESDLGWPGVPLGPGGATQRERLQNQALCALIFLYRHVLEKDVGFLDDLIRAKRPSRLPVVLTPEETGLVFAQLEAVVLLISRLLYGSGMRLLECLRMRVKDLDFRRNEITVRDDKGGKDRVTMLPVGCGPELRDHLETMRRLHEDDLAAGLGRAPLPGALKRKYPNADRLWGWQYVVLREPQNNQMQRTRSEMARRRGPRR